MRRTSFVALLVIGAVLVPLAVFASHQFNDVPDGHTFHNAIDWMKDNDITVGCNPPANTNYCPDDNVTRGQMAAFMKRLAENQVVDAATLRGQGTSAYQSPIWGTDLDLLSDGAGSITGTAVAGTRVLSLQVSPSADGVLALDYTLGVGGEFSYSGWAWLQYDDGSCHLENSRIPASGYLFSAEGGLVDGVRQMSATVAISTTSGSHTIHLCAANIGGNPIGRHSASIVATFSTVGVAGS